jgi:hypothetical protein
MRAREIDDEQNPEPIPGLPAKLPEGEKILWQGSPGVVALAIHAFRARAITVYFAVIALWRCAAMASSGATTADILEVMSAIAMFFAVAMALIFTLAYLMKKETIYTITSRRVVLRFGVALRKTVTIPFRLIASASTARAWRRLRRRRFGADRARSDRLSALVAACAAAEIRKSRTDLARDP